MNGHRLVVHSNAAYQVVQHERRRTERRFAGGKRRLPAALPTAEDGVGRRGAVARWLRAVVAASAACGRGARKTCVTCMRMAFFLLHEKEESVHLFLPTCYVRPSAILFTHSATLNGYCIICRHISPVSAWLFWILFCNSTCSLQA